MRFILALSGLALLGACDRDDGDTGARTENERRGIDTVIESETIRDTTIIRADTTIDVDTLKQTDHLRDRRTDS